MSNHLSNPTDFNKIPKNYNGIDLIKFICAIMVFTIHIPLINAPIGQEISGVATHINLGLREFVCRLAVPFYFVSSGFFLFEKMPKNTLDIKRIENYCFKLLRLLGSWSVLLFIGGTYHLWYLGATVVAVTLLSVCLHFNAKTGHLVLLAIILYTIGLLGNSYFGLIKPFTTNAIFENVYDIWGFFVTTTRNGLFMGFLFVLIGFFFAQGKIQLKKVFSLVGFCVSFVFLLGEVFLLTYYEITLKHDMYIFLIPSVFFLFSFSCSLQLNDRPIYARMRSIGMLVYFLHPFADALVLFANEILYNILNIDMLPFRFFTVLLTTLLVATYIEWLYHKDKFKWLRWLIS